MNARVRRSAALAAAVVALFASTAQAAPSAKLTLNDALSRARELAPQKRQAEADLAAAQARAEGAQAGLRPQVSLSSSYQFGPARQNINQVNVPVTNLGNYSLNANGSWLIYDFGQTGARARASAVSAEAQAWTAESTSRSVALSVRTAFFAARANQTLQAVAEETLKNQERHLQQTKSFVAIGTRAPIDVAQTAKDVANARLSLINAQNAAATSRAQLNQAMGVEGDTNYAVADESAPAVPGEDGSLDALMDAASRERPDLQAMASRLEAQRLTVEAAEHGSYPSLNASGGAGANGSPVSSPNLNWSLGAGLSWPLYTGGSREAQADEARANLASLQAQADVLRQQVRLALEQARLAVVAQKEAAKAAAESTRNARVQLELAEGRYTAGVGSVIELGDAQLAYATARAQEIQVSYQLATARAQLLFALGRE